MPPKGSQQLARLRSVLSLTPDKGGLRRHLWTFAHYLRVLRLFGRPEHRFRCCKGSFTLVSKVQSATIKAVDVVLAAAACLGSADPPSPFPATHYLEKQDSDSRSLEEGGGPDGMALQPYVPPGTGSSGAIVSYTGQQISVEEREKRIKDVRYPMAAHAQTRSRTGHGLDTKWEAVSGSPHGCA